MDSIVITGVSTGIGRACARDLIARGRHVFGSVRKQEDADRLKQEFGDAFTPLLFDVTDEAAVAAAARQVETALAGAPLAGLVNNAGVAVSGPLMHIPLDEVRQQFEINVLGMISVTQKFLPMLGARKGFEGRPGRIVNISSVSGERALPMVGPYSISKFGVEALTESLRREMMIYGIDVIAIAPGPVKTEIWDKAEEADPDKYAGTDFHGPVARLKTLAAKMGEGGLPASKIADAVRKALFDASPKTRYRLVPNYFQDVLIPSLLGPRTLDKIVAKTLGLQKL